jgi:hypothetical protein
MWSPLGAHTYGHERRQEILPELQSDDNGTGRRVSPNPRRIEPNGARPTRVRGTLDALSVPCLLAFCIYPCVLKAPPSRNCRPGRRIAGHRPGVNHALPPAGARREGAGTGRGVVGLELRHPGGLASSGQRSLCATSSRLILYCLGIRWLAVGSPCAS